MTSSTPNQSSNPIDVYVGARVRLQRKARGFSQSDLGDALGLTFQQVQKYERGTNRISASKLYETSQALNVPVAFFFEGYHDEASADFMESTSEKAVNGFLSTGEGIEIAHAFPRIKSAKHRRRVAELVKTLAED